MLNHQKSNLSTRCVCVCRMRVRIRDLYGTLADLSKEPVIKCEPSEDFIREVIVFLWPVSLSDSFKSLPVCSSVKHQVENKLDSPRNIKEVIEVTKSINKKLNI